MYAIPYPWRTISALRNVPSSRYTYARVRPYLEDYPAIPDLAGYSGAEIRQVAIEAAYNGGNLEDAIKFVIPLSKSNKDQIDGLRKWAAGRTIPASIPTTESDASIFDFARAVKWER